MIDELLRLAPLLNLLLIPVAQFALSVRADIARIMERTEALADRVDRIERRDDADAGRVPIINVDATRGVSKVI